MEEPPVPKKRLKAETSTSRDDSDNKTSIFCKYLKFIEVNKNYDLDVFFKKNEPITPVEPVEMDAFNKVAMQDNIIMNLYRQKIKLTEATMKAICSFLQSSFINVTQKVVLQIFVHMTKQDFTGKDPLEASAAFNRSLQLYLRNYKEMNDKGIECVKLASADLVSLIKEKLTKPVILQALKQSLSLVFKKGLDVNNLKQEITTLNIYLAENFIPLPTLRGVCLADGIFICTKNLPFRTGVTENKFKADLVTLSMHEACHYLARKKSKDFNFSSPFKFGSDYTTTPRMDVELNRKFLELGRNVELIVFNKIQPDWAVCQEEAAETFLKRLETSSKLPVICGTEDVTYLVARESPSPGFAVDMADNISPLC